VFPPGALFSLRGLLLRKRGFSLRGLLLRKRGFSLRGLLLRKRGFTPPGPSPPHLGAPGGGAPQKVCSLLFCDSLMGCEGYKRGERD
jgi:hypothetical protein